MQAIAFICFGLLCAGATVIAPLAGATVLLMLMIEQAMQAAAPALRAGSGGQAINYAIGITEILAVSVIWSRRPDVFRGSANPALLLTVGLLAWAAATVVWSPGREEGVEIIAWGLPYLVVVVLLGPLLISDIDELARTNWWVIAVGTVVTLVVLISPEFQMKYGRLTLNLGNGIVTSALAIGELGGTLVITAALARGGELGPLGTLLRLAAIASGVSLAVMSGSRGQFLFSLITAVIFIPIAAPVRNFRVFVTSAIAIAIVLVSSFIAMDLILEGFAAKRFSADELVYGSSSASGRMRNVGLLFSEWASNPAAILIGLGYSAFSAHPNNLGEPYSHVIFADAIFELGLPGAALMTCLMWTSIRSSLRLLQANSMDPKRRSAAATLVALIFYQVLLVNKQGCLWGVPVLFMYCVIASRLDVREGGRENPPLPA